MIVKQSFLVTETLAQKIWSLEDVKNYLRITSDFDNELITHLLETSVKIAENFTGMNLIQKKISMSSTDRNARRFFLKYTPITEIQKIIIKCNNVEAEIASNDYLINLATATLELLKELKRDEIIIDYSIGIDQKLLPSDIKQGILIHTCRMFERQEGNSLPMEVKNLYAFYRNIRI